MLGIFRRRSHLFHRRAGGIEFVNNRRPAVAAGNNLVAAAAAL